MAYRRREEAGAGGGSRALRTAIFLCLAVLFTAGLPSRLRAAPAEVWFSPNGGAEAALVQLIDGARTRIDAAVYTFTNRALAQAVVRAHKRGVKIRLILDGNDESDYSKGYYLRQRGIDVRYARGLVKQYRSRKKQSQKSRKGRHRMRKYGLMHHKFAVVDGKSVSTGSFNWTASAERFNYENMLILKSPALARRYTRTFEEIWEKTFRK